MKFITCSVPVASMRCEPSHKSEMISQLVFGEKMILLEDEGPKGWNKVRARYDNYEGWISASHFVEIKEERYNKPDNILTADWVNEIDFNGYKMNVPLGCSLSAFNTTKVPWSRDTVKFKGNTWDVQNTEFSEKLFRQTAYKFLNTPYLWGGKSVFGIDCSGFSQTVLKLFGVKIPRDSGQQVMLGETVNFLTEAKCGDVAFFDDEEGNIVHVGLLLSHGEIIHSSGKVRMDKIDHLGIINIDTGERTHHLRIIKRFFQPKEQ